MIQTLIDHDRPNVPQSSAFAVAGLDVGTVGTYHYFMAASKDGLVVYLERIPGGELVSRVSVLMRMLNVRMLVVDANPETTQAAALAGAFPGRVLLAYYPNGVIKGGNYYAVDRVKAKVDIDRARSLDVSAQDTIMQRTRFPMVAGEERELLCNQMAAMQRTTETDAQGNPVSKWIETAADHYRHAHNYMTVALDIMSSSGGSVSGIDMRPPTALETALKDDRVRMRDKLGRPVDPTELRGKVAKAPS